MRIPIALLVLGLVASRGLGQVMVCDRNGCRLVPAIAGYAAAPRGLGLNVSVGRLGAGYSAPVLTAPYAFAPGGCTGGQGGPQYFNAPPGLWENGVQVAGFTSRPGPQSFSAPVSVFNGSNGNDLAEMRQALLRIEQRLQFLEGQR